jgi:hypothetical protein
MDCADGAVGGGIKAIVVVESGIVRLDGIGGGWRAKWEGIRGK